MNENVIEWLKGQNRVTVTLSQGRYISKVKKLAEKYPDEVEVVAENKDGSIVAHVPLRYIKISRPKEMTEEQKQKAAERLQRVRSNGTI
jgi:U3 small nucleolar ribonucleoprotein component